MTSQVAWFEQYNYEQLVTQIEKHPQCGIGKCYTPINIEKLDELCESMRGEGWDTQYNLSVNVAGREIVTLYWEYNEPK